MLDRFLVLWANQPARVVGWSQATFNLLALLGVYSINAESLLAINAFISLVGTEFIKDVVLSPASYQRLLQEIDSK